MSALGATCARERVSDSVRLFSSIVYVLILVENEGCSALTWMGIFLGKLLNVAFPTPFVTASCFPLFSHVAWRLTPSTGFPSSSKTSNVAAVVFPPVRIKYPPPSNSTAIIPSRMAKVGTTRSIGSTTAYTGTFVSTASRRLYHPSSNR